MLFRYMNRGSLVNSNYVNINEGNEVWFTKLMREHSSLVHRYVDFFLFILQKSVNRAFLAHQFFHN